MGEYEDLIQRVRDEGNDDLADELSRFSNQEMRKRVGRTAELESQVKILAEELGTVRAAPKREEALRKVGVDLTRLSPAEAEILAAQKVAEGKEYDEEWARGLVERYKLPVAEGGGTGEPRPKAAGVVEKPPPVNPGKTAVSMAEFAGWDKKKQFRFWEWSQSEKQKTGVDLYDVLGREGAVNAAGFPG